MRFALPSQEIDPSTRRADSSRRSRAGAGRAAYRDHGWENIAFPEAAVGPSGEPRDTAPHRHDAAAAEFDAWSRDAWHHRHYSPEDGVDAALAEITARQQVLDGVPAEPRGAPASHDMAHADPSRVEHQLREIAGRIRALQNAARAENHAVPARTVESAVPKRTIEGIEAQLRRLTGQLDSLRSAAPDNQGVEALRRDLAEVAERVDAALPRGAAAAIQDQIGALSNDIAQLGALPRLEDITAALRHDLDGIAVTLESVIPQRTAAAIADEIQGLNARIGELGASANIEAIGEALRRDLVEIGAVLHEAMPTSAIAALEQEVRVLGERIEASHGAGVPMMGSTDLEMGLAEVRDRLGAMMPAEDMARLSDAITTLSDKADAMAADRMASEMVEQLEHAIGALHGLVAQAASQDAVDGLARDIHAPSPIRWTADRGRHDADAEMMLTLDHRLAEMADAIGRSRSPERPAGPTRISI